ncbi:MAG: nitronate monooxygenase [Proteobacteria bacterium]|nr:nitronate monooxygenase [Pseudomonadota bacterium]
MKLMQTLQISRPIIQAGMVWVSGGKLAAAAANAGCLGVIGAGSMKPELLREHILKAQSLTSKSLAVNVPLLYEKSEEQVQTALDLGLKIFITSAGSPKKFTSMLKSAGCTVLHVVSTPELALKCEDAGVDAVIAEGFEAGGHNGRDELTTMALIPQVVDAVKIPVVAAGGIGDGRAIAAALSLGAECVQMGTRFIATHEASAHDNFKQVLVQAQATDTMLMMKRSVPVRLFKNKFYEQIKAAEESCADKTQLEAILGRGRAKLGMLEGNMDEGEIEIGQIAGLVRDIVSVKELVDRLMVEYHQTIKELPKF